jgi:NADP-dependent 3-hydroxy acid dehydrogenase YdfG
MLSGAAGNLGQAVTKIFLSKGAHVVALDIMDQALQTAYPSISDRISTYAIDLTDIIACKALFYRLAEEKK